MAFHEEFDNLSSISGSDSAFQTRTIRELADLRLAESSTPRLLLPPIQRSLVWSNEQIINYWDSLLRGYPAGMMMFHVVKKSEGDSIGEGCDVDGKTSTANDGDWQLFDGQQRMAAVLLGLGKGQLKTSRKLWVDLGAPPSEGSGLKFQLRMTSVGQPFGYKSDAPNQKIEVSKRKSKWDAWEKDHKSTARDEAFDSVKGSDIIDVKYAIKLQCACRLLGEIGENETIAELGKKIGSENEIVVDFVKALKGALDSKVILQRVESKIVSNQEEYIRFFQRIGQGGTRLSDDELTYSIIKNQYPKIRDVMTDIMKDAGRLASEVNLVLAALRVAKTMVPWDRAKDWEVIGRPNPASVTKMKDQGTVESEFVKLIGLQGETGLLKSALVRLREALQYESPHLKGLPPMLLARLPRELVDVLILFAIKRGADLAWECDDRDTLRAFVLHWLLFVGDDGKAAWHAYRSGMDPHWAFAQESIRKLISNYESEGIAHVLPRRDALPDLRKEVRPPDEEPPDDRLRLPSERFTAVDIGCQPGEAKPGDALRALSTNLELIRRALMWLQRDYIWTKFPNYDPTSDCDDDLPIDLDHIIPQDIFNFYWADRRKRLQDDVISEPDTYFRWPRDKIGNSLGNFRWLDASDNRSRHDGLYEAIKNKHKSFENKPDWHWDWVPNPNKWNTIIPKDKNNQNWSKRDISTFQRLIDLRTLELYEKLITESGIEDVLPSQQAQSDAT
jgi:hypothetical protein